MLRLFLLAGAAAFMLGCSTIHRVELQTANVAPPHLSAFWLANGFEPKDSPCVLLAPALRRDVSQRVDACWERWYRGWWWIIPETGGLYGREVNEDGYFVVYIYSIGRETEATAVADNLRLFLSAHDPDLRVLYSEKHFVDVR